MSSELAYRLSFHWPDLQAAFKISPELLLDGKIIINDMMIDHFTKTDWLIWAAKNILLGYLVREGE